MPSVKELLTQIETLQRQVDEARHRETADAVAKVRALIDEYQLDVNDVFPGSRAAKPGRPRTARAPRSAGVAKYRDPASGKTWSGRGRSPAWLAGKDKSQFLIR